MKTRISFLLPVSRPGISMLCLFLMLTAHLCSTRTFAQSSASTPRTISYQGSVKSESGAVLNGKHTITASLYSDRFGKNALWQGSYQSQITDGIFTILLGSETAKLPENGALDRQLWVGIRIDGGVEMQPLTELSAAPYALNVPDQSITMAKLSPDVVLGIEKTPTPQAIPNWTNGLDPYSSSLGQFLGTNNLGGGDLEIRVQNIKVMHYSPGAGVPNINGGFAGNFIGAGLRGVIICGGGDIGAAANTISSDFGFIGGGTGNGIAASSNLSAISGGDQNSIFGLSDHSFIGGGKAIGIEANFSVIAGGDANHISPLSDHTFIGGGSGNNVFVSSDHSTISGGNINVIDVSAPFCTIGGGDLNRIFAGTPSTGDLAHHNTIGGGGSNTIAQGTLANGTQYGSNVSTISGGFENQIFDGGATIGGGYNNHIFSGTSTIGGGSFNIINGPALLTPSTPPSPFSDITGGVVNQTNGFNNTILGGNDNVTSLAEQIAAGYINDISHNGISPFPLTFADAGLAAIPPTPANAITPAALSDQFNAPLFMIGNGNGSFFSRTAPHNAFEVSYNGHTLVTDINGTGQPHDQVHNPNTPDGRPAIEGATYDDNIVYAWGNITESGHIVSDFGVLSSQIIGSTGLTSEIKYLIVLNQVLPDNTNTQRVFTDGSVTATIRVDIDDPETMINMASSTSGSCRSISCSQLFPHVVGGVIHTAFLVFITRQSLDHSESGEMFVPCGSSSAAFNFKVCGRRHVVAGDPQHSDPVN